MRILVYPFKNTGPKQFSWVSAGLSETLISDLRRLENKTIEVISSADRKKALKELAFQQSGLVSNKQVTKIGKLVGANLICTGSYSIIGGRIRIFVKISSVEPRKVLKDSKLTGSFSSIFEIQDRIAVNLMKDAGDVRINDVAQVVTTEELIEKVNESYRPKPAAFKWYSKGLEIENKNPKQALEYFEKAIRISPNYVDALRSAGYTAGSTLSLFSKANAYLQMAKSELEKLRKKNTIDYANLMIAFGLVFVDKGQPDRALEYFGKSQKIYDHLGSMKTMGYSSLLNNIGLVYSNKGQPDRALEYYGKSQKIEERLGLQKTIGYATLIMNTGIVYGQKGLYDRALKYLHKNKAILDHLGLQYTIEYAKLLVNIGIAYGYKGRSDRELEYYGKSQKIYDQLGLQNTDNYANLFINIGVAYFEKGQPDRALEYYGKSQKIYDQLGLQKTANYTELMNDIRKAKNAK